MPSKVYPFVNLLSPRDSARRVRPALVRDVLPAMEVVAALAADGYAFGGIRLNHPPHPGAGANPLLPVDLSELEAGDRLLSVSRLPLHPEWEEDAYKPSRRGYTDLEEVLMAVWARHFTLLTRWQATLAPELARALPPHYADRCQMVFYQSQGARYRQLGRRRYTGDPRTAVFLVHRPELCPGGPGYIGLMGLDGTAAMIWAHLLRTRHPELLREPGFLMAELCGRQIPDRPTDLRFTDDWKVEIVLQRAV